MSFVSLLNKITPPSKTLRKVISRVNNQYNNILTFMQTCENLIPKSNQTKLISELYLMVSLQYNNEKQHDLSIPTLQMEINIMLHSMSQPSSASMQALRLTCWRHSRTYRENSTIHRWMTATNVSQLILLLLLSCLKRPGNKTMSTQL